MLQVNLKFLKIKEKQEMSRSDAKKVIISGPHPGGKRVKRPLQSEVFHNFENLAPSWKIVLMQPR